MFLWVMIRLIQSFIERPRQPYKSPYLFPANRSLASTAEPHIDCDAILISGLSCLENVNSSLLARNL